MRAWIIAALLAVGCTTTPPPVAPPAGARTVTLSCDGEERLTVAYRDGRATVTDAGGKSVVLAQAPTASGTLYEGSGISLREHQGVILYVAADEEAKTCRAAGGDR